jgi:hypothetical protein
MFDGQTNKELLKTSTISKNHKLMPNLAEKLQNKFK